MDLKNIIAAIALSAAVIVLYGLFFAPSQEQLLKLNETENKNVNLNADTPTIEEKIELKTISREEAISNNGRLFFENEFIRGSILLKGGAIDDLELKTYNRTLRTVSYTHLTLPTRLPV